VTQKTDNFINILPKQSLYGAGETKLNTTKSHKTSKPKDKNKHKCNSHLVASYDFLPGNKMGFFLTNVETTHGDWHELHN